MRTIELLREVTAVGLTDMWLDRLAESVESVLRREMPRAEGNWRDGENLAGEFFPERMTG